MSRAAQPAVGPRRPTEDITHRFEAVRGHLRGKLDREIDDAEVFEELFEAFWAQEPTPDPDPEATTLTEIAQNGSDGSQSDAGLETAQASGELACGHDAAYAQGEDCLICDRRFNTDEERRARTAAASDDLEGKL